MVAGSFFLHKYISNFTISFTNVVNNRVQINMFLFLIYLLVGLQLFTRSDFLVCLWKADDFMKFGLSCTAMFSFYIVFLSYSGPGCSKLTASLVNISLKFKKLISEIHQYFFEKLSEDFALFFFNKKYQFLLVIKS